MKTTDFLTELSTDKLAQYKTAAAADASKADKEGDFKRGDKRFSGIVKATKKQFANDAKKDVAEGSEWETRHDEFTTVGDRATPEQINKIVKALVGAAQQTGSKRGFLNQLVGKQSNGDLARMAHVAETLAKNIQRNINTKPGTDERKELGQHLVYAVSLLKRMNGKEGVAEGHDSEDLANEVYAEFERTYPNLARRADERTIHAAIMDVLNYGGDNNPGALAQDVARAVKQDMQQGVAEGDKKPYPKTWHNVDPKLGKQVDKMSQAEKVKKGLAHPDTLKKQGVAEAAKWRSDPDAYDVDDEGNKTPRNPNSPKFGYDPLQRRADTANDAKTPRGKTAALKTSLKMAKGNKGVAEGKWDPFTGGDYGQTPRPQRVGQDTQDTQDSDAAAADKKKDQEEWEAMLDYYGTNALVARALGDLYQQTHGTGYYDSVLTPVRYIATISSRPTPKSPERIETISVGSKKEAHERAKGRINGRVVSIERVDDKEDEAGLITLPVMLGLGQQKKKWMLQFPDERYAQKWAFTHKNVATILWPAGHNLEKGVAEGWSQKYKSSINCSHPKGFSQKAHCAGKKKHNESIEMEMTCPDCGMCETHINQENLDEACWKGYHKEGNKKMFGKTYPNCVKNEGVAEGSEEKDNLISTLNSFGYYTEDSRVYVNDNGDKIVRAGSEWKHQSGKRGRGAEELGNFLSSNQDVVEEQRSCPHCGGELVSEELMNEKKDACYYKVKSRYKVWPSAYASGALVKCRNKGASNWGNGGKKNESSILEGIEQADESLHDWFNKEKWVRMDTKGKIKGPCAREPGEGKPKCLPQSKAHSLGKKGRASAAARKRREDPNPERSGKAINVNTKKKD